MTAITSPTPTVFSITPTTNVHLPNQQNGSFPPPFVNHTPTTCPAHAPRPPFPFCLHIPALLGTSGALSGRSGASPACCRPPQPGTRKLPPSEVRSGLWVGRHEANDQWTTAACSPGSTASAASRPTHKHEPRRKLACQPGLYCSPLPDGHFGRWPLHQYCTEFCAYPPWRPPCRQHHSPPRHRDFEAGKHMPLARAPALGALRE